ncbi:MAG TPA: GspH/FimT family pseudopilin [Blastocatellia bacterium]|nr:GspH/FimT family pseudopilin [Blastocatellia bacterium]
MVMNHFAFRHGATRRRGSQAGFGVIELSVVVAVAAILVSASLIIITKARTRYQLSQNARNLTSQIERARALAIKYNQTLTVGFTSNNTVFGLTCTGCTEPKNELPDYSLPSGFTLSAYPTLTIRGNGTISSTSSSVQVTDGQYRLTISISNSGRTSVNDVASASN